MEKEFNYQIVFKLENDVRIIFAGVTPLTVAHVIRATNSVLKDGLSSNLFDSSICESLVFQPINSDENESQEKK